MTTAMETFMASPLEPIEQEMLVKREAVIEEAIVVGRKAFITVGAYLTMIRDATLYREHGSFEDYVDQRWGLQRAHAYRLIDAARVAQALSPIGDTTSDRLGFPTFPGTPQNEAQARELARLKDKHLIRQVWREITDSETTITAAVVAEHVDRALGLERDSRELAKPESKRRGTRTEYLGELLRDIERIANVEGYLETVRFAPARRERELQRIDLAISFLQASRVRIANVSHRAGSSAS